MKGLGWSGWRVGAEGGRLGLMTRLALCSHIPVCRLSSQHRRDLPTTPLSTSARQKSVPAFSADQFCPSLHAGAVWGLSEHLQPENLESLPKSLHLHEFHSHEVPHNAQRLPFLPSAFFLTVFDSFPRAQSYPPPRHHSDFPKPTPAPLTKSVKHCFSYIPPLCKDHQL